MRVLFWPEDCNQKHVKLSIELLSRRFQSFISHHKISAKSFLILFRILFIAYAEDKDLLPYKSNDLYKKRSLKNIALELKKKIPPP